MRFAYILLAACAAGAAETVVQLDTLPAPVRTTSTGSTGGSAVDRVTVDDAQSTVIYAATYRDAQTKEVHTIRVAGDGKLLASGPSTNAPAIGVPSAGVPLSEAPPAAGRTP